MKLRRSPRGFTLIELLVVISIIAILASFAMPAFTAAMTTAKQATVLSNARQIGIGLSAWAVDHDQTYPYADDQDAAVANATTTPANASDANKALANLIPQYLPSEKIFWIPKSGWCNKLPPDEKKGTSLEKLSAGENHFAYVINLSTTSNPNWPLLAEGFAEGTTPAAPAYAADETVAGGLWKGKAAVIVYADGSARKEILDPTDRTVKAATGGGSKANIFVYTAAPDANSSAWLGTNTTVLNPVMPVSQ